MADSDHLVASSVHRTPAQNMQREGRNPETRRTPSIVPSSSTGGGVDEENQDPLPSQPLPSQPPPNVQKKYLKHG